LVKESKYVFVNNFSGFSFAVKALLNGMGWRKLLC
jgi:hypothetical protein